MTCRPRTAGPGQKRNEFETLCQDKKTTGPRPVGLLDCFEAGRRQKNPTVGRRWGVHVLLSPGDKMLPTGSLVGGWAKRHRHPFPDAPSGQTTHSSRSSSHSRIPTGKFIRTQCPRWTAAGSLSPPVQRHDRPLRMDQSGLGSAEDVKLTTAMEPGRGKGARTTMEKRGAGVTTSWGNRHSLQSRVVESMSRRVSTPAGPR